MLNQRVALVGLLLGSPISVSRTRPLSLVDTNARPGEWPGVPPSRRFQRLPAILPPGAGPPRARPRAGGGHKIRGLSRGRLRPFNRPARSGAEPELRRRGAAPPCPRSACLPSLSAPFPSCDTHDEGRPPPPPACLARPCCFATAACRAAARRRRRAKHGRGGGNRTRDLQRPRLTRCQTAPHPEERRQKQKSRQDNGAGQATRNDSPPRFTSHNIPRRPTTPDDQ